MREDCRVPAPRIDGRTECARKSMRGKGECLGRSKGRGPVKLSRRGKWLAKAGRSGHLGGVAWGPSQLARTRYNRYLGMLATQLSIKPLHQSMSLSVTSVLLCSSPDSHAAYKNRIIPHFAYFLSHKLAFQDMR